MNYEQILTYVYIALVAIVIILLIVLAVEKQKVKKPIINSNELVNNLNENVDKVNDSKDKLKKSLEKNLPSLFALFTISTTLKLFRKNYKKTKSFTKASAQTYIKKTKPIKRVAKAYFGI